MIPVQPEELSALIDGELDPQRTSELKAQIAADPALRASFEALRDLDNRWRAAARTAAFIPQIRPPAPARWNGWLTAVAVAAALVGMRIAVRATDTTTTELAVQALVLAAVLTRITWLGLSDTRLGVDPEPQGVGWDP